MLGLPLLEAMGDLLLGASARAAATGQAASALRPPVRMAFLYFPNGVWEAGWFPEEPGREYCLPYALEPLAEHRRDLLVFSGLDKKHSHQGDGHYAKTANFLTGLPVHKTPGKDINVGGISVDQFCRQHIGQLTPLPSLELGGYERQMNSLPCSGFVGASPLPSIAAIPRGVRQLEVQTRSEPRNPLPL